MIEASEYIEQIVNNIDDSIKGKFDVGSGRYLTCDTKWARIGKTITDLLGNVYRITDLVTDEYIVAEVITGSGDLDGIAYLESPFFITGTKMATNQEWLLVDPNLSNKLPLIWLLEIISETGYGRGSALDRDIEIRLFFLDETDPSQYYTKDHREQVVKPMQKLMDQFLISVAELREYKAIENYRYRTFSRFGVEQDNGVIQNVLDANLSGVALEVTLTRFKQNCKC